MGVEPAGDTEAGLLCRRQSRDNGRRRRSGGERGRSHWRQRFGSFSIMRKSTVLLAALVLLLLLAGGAYVLSLDAKPTVELVEKVFPNEQFPR